LTESDDIIFENWQLLFSFNLNLTFVLFADAYGQVWSTVSSAAAIGSAVQLNCSFPGRPTSGIAQLKFFNTSVLSASYSFYFSLSPGSTPTEYYPELFTVEENPLTYDEFGVTVLSLSRTTSTAYECSNVINSGVQAFITGLGMISETL